MERYKLIIVDDENEVRGRVTEKISTQRGFEVVGTASNGYDAIDLIEKLSPHVVLTDIKMPYIDGLELASIIQQDYPTIRVAFLSGYDEFDYAQKAINLNVISYLTKPVTSDDISQFLKRIKEELDREAEEQHNIQQLQDQYHATIPLLTENYLTSLLMNPSPHKKSEQPKPMNIAIQGDYIVVQVKADMPRGEYSILEHEKQKISLRSLMEKTFKRHNILFHCLQFAGSIICLIQVEGDTFAKRMDTIFFEMIKLSEKILSTNIHIGVSNPYHSILDLSTPYEETNRALHHASYLGPSDIVYINQLQKPSSDTYTLPIGELQNLEYIAKMGTLEEVSMAFKNLGNSLANRRMNQLAFQSFLIHLAHIVTSVGESLELVSYRGKEGSLLQVLGQFQGVEEALDWGLKRVTQIREENVEKNVSRAEALFQKALNLIAIEYTNPKLAMVNISDTLKISQSYLSLLFKQHNMTFVKYLTSIRIEKAKELLARTPQRIIEVAEKCGYSDVYYFSHSFKKYEGVSPKRYREQIQNS